MGRIHPTVSEPLLQLLAVCARYADWLKRQQRSMQQTHRAGDKLFIDYAGPTVPVNEQ